MSLEMTRRSMMATTSAAAAIGSLPLSLTIAPHAHARSVADNDLCLSQHDWLSRRLHDVLKRDDGDETYRNHAIKTNTCSNCGIHIGAADHGLIAH